MSEKLQKLAARKQLLLARSKLIRLQIRHQVYGVRSGVSWVNVGMHAATSAPVRSALFGLALSSLGHSRVARVLAIASKAILFAKITGVALDIKRGLRRTSANDTVAGTLPPGP
ncbi:MAG: hypothetical protein ABW049_06665 [Spongiibacteraceae bacterium]